MMKSAYHAFDFAAHVGAKELVPCHYAPWHDDETLDRLDLEGGVPPYSGAGTPPICCIRPRASKTTHCSSILPPVSRWMKIPVNVTS